MFKFFKEKITNWAKKISFKKEKEVSEGQKEKKPKKEILMPMKFNAGAHKYEPDLEKLKEIQEEKEKPGFFESLKEKITQRKVKISEQEFEVYAEDLQMLLLENNVAYDAAEKIIQELKERTVGDEMLAKEVEPQIKGFLREIISDILIQPRNIVEEIKKKKDGIETAPYVILFLGINGSGKTTTIAKVTDFLKRNNISCVIAAADTFRAASIEQIKKHGDALGVKVISHDYGSDPAAVGFDAISYAKKNNINCVLIDTAGRMHTAKNLMKEIEKISRICKPDLKIFVGESIAGNDSIEQAKTFDTAVGIDGIILTKADVDEKGGTAISVGYVTKKPILFLGTGQEYSRLEPFDKEKFLKSLGL